MNNRAVGNRSSSTVKHRHWWLLECQGTWRLVVHDVQPQAYVTSRFAAKDRHGNNGSVSCRSVPHKSHGWKTSTSVCKVKGTKEQCSENPFCHLIPEFVTVFYNIVYSSNSTWCTEIPTKVSSIIPIYKQNIRRELILATTPVSSSSNLCWILSRWSLV